ncbi:hypothetical protein QJS04_geneDACA020928 [Acorus gramineus]|uniref:Reverse transcriptase n=1 Tax=Acorus gramineus TaxID=55184 RepID=A0AAV9B1R5_ACOGR|nr:hypothetical protein QJS04_geneDACA020928 [Acorus gramineus]
MLTGVYGPNVHESHPTFWEEFQAIRGLLDNSWCVLGDFNTVSTPKDRSSQSWSPREVRAFCEWVSDIGLIKIPLSNHRFNWSNLCDRTVLSKLDRCFMDANWEDVFPVCRLQGWLDPAQIIFPSFSLRIPHLLGPNISDLRSGGLKRRAFINWLKVGGPQPMWIVGAYRKEKKAKEDLTIIL